MIKIPDKILQRRHDLPFVEIAADIHHPKSSGFFREPFAAFYNMVFIWLNRICCAIKIAFEISAPLGTV